MTELTRAEQEAGIARVRRWAPRAVEEVRALPPRERDLVILAAGLLDLEPGVPTMAPVDIIEVDLR
jgi:hypothetical protein